MPFNDCTTPLTPEERRRRLAALLATGLLRLGSRSETAPTSAAGYPGKILGIRRESTC